ncbi:unnamed protein product [Pieris brassicae]|uniref:Uncharacterized protein n=1 Tax=Pieris brassicae TaxID=7116 RepID=A0A9P0TUK1_PIEBR|nr:unnamed protein product [Pieris brassicae]
MANYFRWKKGKRDDDMLLSEKPRSRSLDPRSLELSGIRLVAQNYDQDQRNVQRAGNQSHHHAGEFFCYFFVINR